MYLNVNNASTNIVHMLEKEAKQYGIKNLVAT